jgi:hypothetical protein
LHKALRSIGLGPHLLVFEFEDIDLVKKVRYHSLSSLILQHTSVTQAPGPVDSSDEIAYASFLRKPAWRARRRAGAHVACFCAPGPSGGRRNRRPAARERCM